MNDQVQMVIRYFLTLAGAYATNKGWLSTTDLSTLTADILAALGPAVMLVTFVWGFYVHSHGARIASVNAIEGVKVVSQNSPGATVTAAPVKP